MAFRPLHDRVLVKRIEAEARTASGLHIPDSAQEKPRQAKVVAVGTGRLLKNGEVRPLSVKEGDLVMFAKYTGEEFKFEGEDHIILGESDILAVIDA